MHCFTEPWDFLPNLGIPPSRLPWDFWQSSSATGRSTSDKRVSRNWTKLVLPILTQKWYSSCRAVRTDGATHAHIYPWNVRSHSLILFAYFRVNADWSHLWETSAAAPGDHFLVWCLQEFLSSAIFFSCSCSSPSTAWCHVLAVFQASVDAIIIGLLLSFIAMRTLHL